GHGGGIDAGVVNQDAVTVSLSARPPSFRPGVSTVSTWPSIENEVEAVEEPVQADSRTVEHEAGATDCVDFAEGSCLSTTNASPQEAAAYHHLNVEDLLNTILGHQLGHRFKDFDVCGQSEVGAKDLGMAYGHRGLVVLWHEEKDRRKSMPRTQLFNCRGCYHFWKLHLGNCSGEDPVLLTGDEIAYRKTANNNWLLGPFSRTGFDRGKSQSVGCCGYPRPKPRGSPEPLEAWYSSSLFDFAE
ncbi:unnamed protein product, partial [Cyprideis torosa]